MALKKFLAGILLLLIAFQSLPVRQAVKYFIEDNNTVEEVPVDKTEGKFFKALDEKDIIHDLHHHSHNFWNPVNTAYFHFIESLPGFHIQDILTPPPNIV